MAAGSADQTWRLAVPGSAKKKKKIPNPPPPKNDFVSKKMMDFKKTAVFAVFKGI